MVFSNEDVWYVLAFKCLVLILAVGLAYRLVWLSNWNLALRLREIKAAYSLGAFLKIVRLGAGFVINLLFIWILFIATAVLLAGYFGVPAASLVEWNIKSLSAIVELAVVVVYLARHRHLWLENNGGGYE